MTNLQTNIKFWEEDTPALYEGRPRATIPEMPSVGDPIETYIIEKEKAKIAFAYLACVIRDTDEKIVVLRALASAVQILFADSANYTGSPLPVANLTGLDVFLVDDSSGSSELSTNFSGAPALTMADIDPYIDCDEDELGGYFGTLFIAGVKRLTTQNATAFNEKRLGTIQAASAVPPKIFIPGSAFLEGRVLNKVYAAFTSLAAIRAQLVHRTALRMGAIRYGPSVTFSALFMLLADSGMGSLKIIKEAVLKCQWVRTDFPELAPELEAADKGQRAIRSAEPPIRPFVKAIFGSSFVPAHQSEIRNLLGISKKVMTHYAATYAQFGGGITTPEQDTKIAQRLGLAESRAVEEQI